MSARPNAPARPRRSGTIESALTRLAPRIGRRTAALALAALVGLAPTAAAGAEEADTLIARAIERAEAGDGAAHRELAGAGRAILPELVARLDQLRPSRSGVPEGAEVEVIARALGLLPTADVHRALAPTAETTDGVRIARIGAVSAYGLPSEVGLLIVLAGPAERPGPVTRAVQTCVERMHRRSTAAFKSLGRTFLDASMPLREAIVRGVAAVDRLESVAILANLLDLAPPLDPLILTSIGRIGSQFPAAVPDRVLGQVRRLLELGDDDPRTREAALVAGRLEDYLALDALIDLLDSEVGGTRRNAHWSLQHVSQIPLEADRYRWMTWLRSNEIWWADSWPQIREALRGGDRSETCEAVREVAGRRYRRHELAREVTRVIDRSDDEVMLTYACLALQSLGSSLAGRHLVDLLDDPRESVQDHAHGALRSLFGLELPPDSGQWRTAIGLGPNRP